LQKPIQMRAIRETWRLQKPFTIARGKMTDAELIVVEIDDGEFAGRGEACPVPHFGESVENSLQEVEIAAGSLRDGMSWIQVHERMTAGAARNAIDCAMWDLESRRLARPVWQLLGLPAPRPLETAFTISLADPDTMAAAALEAAARGHRLLKLKLGGAGDLERLRAVRAAVPAARLIADVNEAWDETRLRIAMPLLADLGLEMLEQPLPAGRDAALADVERLVPVCADESCHVRDDLERVRERYDMINIKLDKTGGLTEAVALAKAAREAGLEFMVGCMLGTSLAMAPAFLVAQGARFVDLDAPLLIGSDRQPGLNYRNGLVSPSPAGLWG